MHQEGDLEWLAPSRIAPFQFVQNQMRSYHVVAPSTEHRGCLVLREPHVAGPRYPLEDARCPVLTLEWYLTTQIGWLSVAHRVSHDSAAIAEFDTRGGVSRRWYLRLLLTKLADSLPLSGGRIPSAEPMAYYRCLLDGIAVLPGLGNAHYVALCNAGRRKAKKDILPLSDIEREPDPPPLDDGPVFADFDPPVTDAPSRGHGGRGGRGRGQGRGRGRGRADPAAPPPVPLPPAPPPLPPAPPPDPVEEPVFASQPDPVDEPRPRKRKRDVPPPEFEGLDGATVTYDGEAEIKGEPYRNYWITCPPERGHPPGCMKTKGITAANTRMGELEPLAFLHAWRSCPFPSKPGVPTHRRENPTPSDVKRYLEEHNDELRALYDRIHN